MGAYDDLLNDTPKQVRPIDDVISDKARERGIEPSSVGIFGKDEIKNIVTSAAEKYGVSPEKLLALGQVESSLNPSAQNTGSSAGGLFQFINDTWKRYGNGQNKFDPVANADAAARMLRSNLDRFGGDYDAALAAHHVGPGKARQALSDSSIGDKDISTQGWLSKINKLSGDTVSSKKTPEQEFSDAFNTDAYAPKTDYSSIRDYSAPTSTSNEQQSYEKQLADQAEREKAGLWGSAKEGAKRGLIQSEGLLGGMGALLGKTGEEAIGQSAFTDWLQNEGMSLYKKKMGPGGESENLSHSASLSDVFDGKVPVTNWMADSAGYLAYQAAESIMTGGFGAIIAKTAGKDVVAATLKPLVAKEVERLSAAAAAKVASGEIAAGAITKEMIAKQAVSNTAQMAGAGAVVFANNLRQEAGGIYPEALESQAKDPSRTADLGRIWASSLGAALVDTGAEVFMGKQLLGLGNGYKGGYAKRLGKEAGANALVQGSTEGVQTVAERFGAKQDLTGEEATRDYVDSIGVGALGGTLGAPVSARRAFTPEQDPALTPPVAQSNSPLTNAVNTAIHEDAKQGAAIQDQTQQSVALIAARDQVSQKIAAIQDVISRRGETPEAVAALNALLQKQAEINTQLSALRSNPRNDMTASDNVARIRQLLDTGKYEDSIIAEKLIKEAKAASLNQQSQLAEEENQSYEPSDVIQQQHAQQAELQALINEEKHNQAKKIKDTWMDQHIARATQGPAAGFADMVEYEKFLKSELEHLAQTRAEAVVTNDAAKANEAQQKEVELQRIAKDIEVGQQKDTAQKRDAVLKDALANVQPGQNPLRAFDRALKAAGFKDTTFTEQEKEKIARWAAFNSIPQEEFDRYANEPAAPNELIVPERKDPAKQEPKKSFAHIDAAIARKFKFNGKALTNPKTGKTRLLKADELAYYKSRIANPQATVEKSVPVPKKKPHQMTRQEFIDDAAFQGVNAATDESNPSYWFTDQSEEAAMFAEGERGVSGSPKLTEPRIDIALKSELGAEFNDSERPSGSKHAYTGKEKNRPVIASVPISAAKDPHRYLVEQALANGEEVPASVLADYPDLVKKAENAQTTQETPLPAEPVSVPVQSQVAEEPANVEPVQAVPSAAEELVLANQPTEEAPLPSDPVWTQVEKKTKKPLSQWTAEEIQARLDRGGLEPESKAQLEALLAPLVADKKAQEEKTEAHKAALQKARESRALFKIIPDRRHPDETSSVTVKNGIALIDGLPALDEVTGKEIAIPEGAGARDVADILIAAGAITKDSASDVKRKKSLDEIKTKYKAEAAKTADAPKKAEAAPDPVKEAPKTEEKESIDSLSDFERGKAMMGEGIAELMSKLGGKSNLTPEEESAIIPIMSKIFRGAALMGYIKFKESAQFVMNQIRSMAGNEIADKIEIKNLQAAYVNLNGFGAAQEIGQFNSVEELMSDSLPAKIEAAEAATDTNPTEAQKNAGNYSKGKVAWNGLTISIETPKGAERTGKDASGKEWSVTMPASYGYFLKTVGADEEHLDVFIGPNPDSGNVFVINQDKVNSDVFDEHKILVGFDTQEEAKAAYFASFTNGFAPRVFGSITEALTIDEFKAALPELEKAQEFNGKPDSEKSIPELQKELESAKFGKRMELNTLLIDLVTKDAEEAINRGEMPVYKTGEDNFIALHPSAQKDGMIQATRYSNRGVFGDSQYNDVREAIRDNALWFKPRMSDADATKAMSDSLAAEAEYQKSKQPAAKQGTQETRELAIKEAQRQSIEVAEDAKWRKEMADKEAAEKAEEDARKEKNRGLSIGERKANADLDKPTKLPREAGVGGAVSRRVAMENAVAQERAIVLVEQIDYAAKRKDEEQLQRAKQYDGYIPGYSNRNHPKFAKGYEASQRLLANQYKKPEYRLYAGRNQEGGFFEITKTEYDYAQKLKTAPVAEVESVDSPKLLATFEEGKTALRIIGDPAFIKERLDAIGIKSVPRKDGVNVTDKKRWADARSVIPVAIETRTIDGVPARLADVTIETMENGNVRLVSQAETGNYASSDEAVKYYRESYKDSPETVEQPTQAEEVEIPAALEDKPVHIEDGEVELATPAVIEKSLKKSVAMTSGQLKEAQKWLEGEIDKAMLNALDGMSTEYKGDMGKMPFSVFDVPGDGTFKIPQFKGNLERFKDRIKTGVFVVGRTPKEQKVSPADRVSGSGTESTISDFLDDGDYLTALEFAKQINKPIIFGWSNPTKQIQPVAYVEARPFKMPGFEDFNFVSAKSAFDKSIHWAILDLSSGLAVRSGYSSRKDAESAGVQALRPNTENPEKTITAEKIHKLIADAFAKNEAGTQEQLEAKWVEWAKKQEDEKDGKNEALKENAKSELQRDNEALDKEIKARQEREAAAVNAENPAKTSDYPFQTSDGKYWSADGKEELESDWVGVFRSGSGKFFYLGQENNERAFYPLEANTYDEAVKEAEPLDRVGGKLENYIKIAADSIKQLRKVDVERVLSQGSHVPKKLVANFISSNRPDLKQEVEDVLAEQKESEDKAKYAAKVAEIKAKQAERAIVPLSEITVTLKARVEDSNEMAEYDEKAEVALKEIDNKMNLARSLIKCLAS